MNRGTQLVLAVVALAHVYTFMHLPVLNNPNENVRIYMTHALAEDGTLAIGQRTVDASGRARDGEGPTARWGYVNDKALVCASPEDTPPICEGTLYSAKAPGTSFLGVPAHLLITAATSEELSLRDLTRALRFLCLTIPTLLFALFFARFLTRHIRRPVVVCAVLAGWGIGSMGFTYGQLFAGHQLTALALFTGFMAWDEGRSATGWARRRADMLFGAGLSFAVLFEYPALFPAVLLGLAFLREPMALRRLGAVVIGALPAGALLVTFHTRAFGAPWRTPYSWLENPGFVADISPGWMGLQAPNWEAFHGSFLAPYNGLFFFAPWMALVLFAAASRLRQGWSEDPSRHAMTAALAVFATYALFISSHSLWRGGWTLGPRYIAGCVPFVALAVGLAIDRSAGRILRVALPTLAGLITASIVITGACSLVSQGFPFEFHNPFTELALPLLLDGHVAENLGNLAGLSGIASIAPLLLVIAITCGALLWASADGSDGWSRLTGLATGAAVLVAALWLATSPQEAFNEGKHKKDRWLRAHWMPEDQAPASARRQALNERRGEGPMAGADWLELGNLEARAGNRAAALARYRAAMEEFATRESGR